MSDGQCVHVWCTREGHPDPSLPTSVPARPCLEAHWIIQLFDRYSSTSISASFGVPATHLLPAPQYLRPLVFQHLRLPALRYLLPLVFQLPLSSSTSISASFGVPAPPFPSTSVSASFGVPAPPSSSASISASFGIPAPPSSKHSHGHARAPLPAISIYTYFSVLCMYVRTSQTSFFTGDILRTQ